MTSLIHRFVGKGRRFAKRALTGGPEVNGDKVQELYDWVNGMQQTVNTTVHRLDQQQARTNSAASESGDHVDLVLDQLWRRLESADARMATEFQRFSADTARRLSDLEDVVGRLRKESAAILRLLGSEELADKTIDAMPTTSLPLGRMTIFAEIERGSSELLQAKLEQYAPYFDGADGPVLDLGCGKGDFVKLLGQRGIDAYGIDLDHDAVTQAKASGVDVREGNFFEHLAELAPNSLGGAFSSQVVEHLPAEMIYELYEALFRVLKPGAMVVVETPNPSTFATHVQSFWRDPTHVRPVPPPTLDFAGRNAGLMTEQIIYTSPSPDSDRLEPIALEPSDPVVAQVIQRFNQHTENLNDLLYGYQDYALVSRKP